MAELSLTGLQQLCKSFPNSEVNDILLIAQNWPQWEYLYQGNWQILLIKDPWTPSLLLTFTHHCPLPAAFCVPGSALRCLSSNPAPSAAEPFQSLAFFTELGSMTALPPFLPLSLKLHPCKNPATITPFILLLSKCPLPPIKPAHIHQKNTPRSLCILIYPFK